MTGPGDSDASSSAGRAQRPFRRRVLQNASAGLAANVWAIAVALVTLPLMIYGLGVANFGRWVLLQTMSASTGWIAVLDGGLAVSATRLVSTRFAVGDVRRTGTALGTTMGSFVVLGTLGAAVALALGWPILQLLARIPAQASATAHVAALLLSVQVATEFVQSGAEACLEGLQRLDLSRAADALRRALFAGATASAALSGGSLAAVEVAAVAASSVGALVALGGLLTQRPRRWSVSFPDLREMLVYATTVALLRPIAALYRLMDRVIVGAVLGPAAVSAVEVATQLQNGADALVSGATAALVPGSAWVEARGDRKPLRETLLSGTRYALLASWPLAAAVAMLATPGIRLWTGTRLASMAAGPARVAMVASAVAAVGQVAGNVLLGAGRGGVILRAAATGVAVDLAVSVALVQPLGVAGVFWGTVAASAVTTPWITTAACRHCGIRLRQFMNEAVARAAVPVIAELAALGVVDALRLSASVTLAIGVPLGISVVAAVGLRSALPRQELAGLWRDLRSGRAARPEGDATASPGAGA